MVELLDLVDELTKPRVEHVPQRSDTGQWIRSHSVEHPSLFDQLRDAGMGESRGGGSGAARHERAPIDLDALYLYQTMAAQVGDWCRMRGLAPRNTVGLLERDPAVLLRAWYADTLKDNDFQPDGWASVLSRWVFQIRDHFDPPVRFEALYKCPVCGADTFGTAVTGGGRAIEISYRIDDDRRVSDERALCRACFSVWRGHDSLMELADEQHEKAG